MIDTRYTADKYDALSKELGMNKSDFTKELNRGEVSDGRKEYSEGDMPSSVSIISSVGGLVLDNHRMVDTASDRLSFLMELMRERLHGDDSASGVCSNDTLPLGSIPLLTDMLGRQVCNNDKIEALIRMVEESL